MVPLGVELDNQAFDYRVYTERSSASENAITDNVGCTALY